jgi:transposase InsO family protein
VSDPDVDPRLQKALDRYQVISSYVADPPPRGRRHLERQRLADRVWTDAQGEAFSVSAETIRAWVRAYRAKGLKGLMDDPRPSRGVSALSDEVIAKACALKKEVPERTLDRIVRILEDLDMVEAGTVKRSTLHRALMARGLSRRPAVPDREDLDRFEAARPNDLWQSDMLVGPWLPDPERPGSVRRAWLYAFLDDHSRLCLHGRFSFKGDLPALELVFRRSLQKWGAPRRVYYDNGQVYRSVQMRQIVASLGIHRPVHTKPRRPMGHGKIEAFNRLVRGSFLAELKASKITTLAELNEAWVAWLARDYNGVVHGETGQAPLDRWRAGIDDVRYVDDERLRQAFLWREQRSADKAGVFSLHGVRFQVGPELAGRRVDVLYDPEDLQQVEVHRDGRLRERVRPLDVGPWRRPRPATADAPPATATPVADWLGHLVQQHRADGVAEPDPRAWKAEALARRDADTEAVLALLHDRLDDGVVDDAEVRAWLARFGPLDPELVERELDVLVARDSGGLHPRFYLEKIREVAR